MDAVTSGPVAVSVVEGGAIGRITLERPEKLNALSIAVLEDLASAAAWFDERPGVKVVVVAGEGASFSAGFDLSVMTSGVDAMRGLVKAGARLANRVLTFPRPTVAACTGHGLAMGAILLLLYLLRRGQVARAASLIYLVPRGEAWMADFEPLPGVEQRPHGVGLYYIDHLTHNVQRGRMDVWAGFYEKLFNFKEIRFFNIEGKLTGLISRALTSPCGKIRIPINESLDDKSQIEEYLRQYKGEGIQHVALGSRDIYSSVEQLRRNGLPFMPSPPDTYYEKVDGRVPNHGEPVPRLKANGILIDGEGAVALGEKQGRMSKVLLQIFSGTVLGPIFFEFIERKGDDGFGEGNFRALFESIEEDQIRRGVLSPAAAE